MVPQERASPRRSRNDGVREEIQFDFQRIAGRCLLNDVHSLGDGVWTLSDPLKCHWYRMVDCKHCRTIASVDGACPVSPLCFRVGRDPGDIAMGGLGSIAARSSKRDLRLDVNGPL